MMTEEERYRIARKRVKEKKRFYSHLTTYLVMGGFFLTLNLITSPGAWWWYWPMLGWGIGIASHGMQVFGLPGSGAGGNEWEQREIEKEMERMSPRSTTQDRALPPVDMDDHLELREIQKERAAEPSYRKDDLV
ncbi:MAG: 2TM domain-containing protein [Bacteroidota bacterium]